MLCFLQAKKVGILGYCCIADSRHRRAGGPNKIAFKGRCNKGGEVDEIAPVRVARIPLKGDVIGKLKINLAYFHLWHGGSLLSKVAIIFSSR